MTSTTVAELASELNKPTETLLEQLASAGVQKAKPTDVLSDADKQTLLSYLQTSHGTATNARKKITLVKKSTSEIKQADARGGARTIQVEVRKKRTFVRRDDEAVTAKPADIELERRVAAAEAEAESLRAEEAAIAEARAAREAEAARQAAADAAAAAEAAKAAADAAKAAEATKPQSAEDAAAAAVEQARLDREAARAAASAAVRPSQAKCRLHSASSKKLRPPNAICAPCSTKAKNKAARPLPSASAGPCASTSVIRSTCMRCARCSRPAACRRKTSCICTARSADASSRSSSREFLLPTW